MRKLIITALLLSLAACTTTQQRTAPAKLGFLHTEGMNIVDEDGAVVQLRGCNSGCWLLIEPWIIGLEWQKGVESEKDLWDLMEKRFGTEAKLDLIKTYRENFFTEEDVRVIAGTGMNCLRIPLWWRAISDPAYGGDIAYLDRCLDWCSKYGVYAIIDLHGAPGGQGDQDVIVGESSNGELWTERSYRDQTVEWWKDIAQRYKDNPTVAGYDLLNEATSANVDQLVAFYDRLYREIRAIDPKHIFFLEDGLLGFHRLPRPRDMGWENVAYSFHYYPQDPAEAYQAAPEIFPKFHRNAMHYGVPILVGEFNSMQIDRGGADLFLRYCEAFDYYGWSWTFWTYKKLEDDYDIIWGLGGYRDVTPWADLNKDSFEEIKETFRQMRTRPDGIHPLIAGALAGARKWTSPYELEEGLAGAKVITLADAFVIPAEKGNIKMQWNRNPPNAGYWSRGDRIAWVTEIEQAGVYEIGLNMANSSDTNILRFWVDGMEVTDVPLPNTWNWLNYQNAPLGNVRLSSGRHVIEMGQVDLNDDFINARWVWLRSNDKAPLDPSEQTLRLNCLNVTHLSKDTSIRMEWFNNPPNFGYWKEAEEVGWDITVAKGGIYEASASYATPNPVTTMRLMLNGMEKAVSKLDGTGDWSAFTATRIGKIQIEPGAHTLSAIWETSNPDGAGNLREIRLDRVE